MLEKTEKSNSLTLLEYHWDAMSYIMTPAALKRFLITTDDASYEYYQRVKGTMMVRMFQLMLQRFMYLRHQNKSVQQLWESYLSTEGYIPICIPKASISNDRFGYRDTQNNWKEWNMVSLQLIRLYWDNIFSNIGYKLQMTLRDICKQLIGTLPGPFSQCECCTWKVPISEMYSDKLCVYCSDYKKYPKLTLNITSSGIPYIQYNQNNNTNNNVMKSCGAEHMEISRSETLIEKMRNLRISG